MPTDRLTTLDDLAQLCDADRASRLAALGQDLLQDAGGLAAGDRDRVVASFVDALTQGWGSSQERLTIGAVLGRLGDPRLRQPSDEGYWGTVAMAEGPVQLGRFMVTTAECRAFVDSGASADDAHWDDAGKSWRDSADATWPSLAASSEAAPFVVDNQPVVGVSWYEAMAYARWVGARLPNFEERLVAVRGAEKRPYPWGSPFGEGNANTQEEVLGQPCAVGLFVKDRSPEGIYDLAGNVAEWCGDGVDSEKWVHPGAWDQPSMAAWAKARVLENPSVWSASLGFRLARDVAQ